MDNFDIDWIQWPAKGPWGWWCLGHNFDVVATILTMSSLSWQKGFDARNVLEHFFDDKEVIADFRENERYIDAHKDARAKHLKLI